MEATYSSETSDGFERKSRHYIPENRNYQTTDLMLVMRGVFGSINARKFSTLRHVFKDPK
jgi:hypothetical protein